MFNQGTVASLFSYYKYEAIGTFINVRKCLI
jgi:hypothetical protein